MINNNFDRYLLVNKTKPILIEKNVLETVIKDTNQNNIYDQTKNVFKKSIKFLYNLLINNCDPIYLFIIMFIILFFLYRYICFNNTIKKYNLSYKKDSVRTIDDLHNANDILNFYNS